MTEQEWLCCTDPGPMLDSLQGKVSDRKLRLFACACCRHIWDLLTDARSRRAVEVMESYADGSATEKQRQATQTAAEEVWNPGEEDDADLDNGPAWAADVLIRGQFIGDQWVIKGKAWASIVVEAAQQGGLRKSKKQAQAILLRDILGNPYRPLLVNPGWQTSSVTALAQCAYGERILPSGIFDPDRLAVLADALEESGCTDADILNHLRGPGPHVRGCHVVDTLLDKSLEETGLNRSPLQ